MAATTTAKLGFSLNYQGRQIVPAGTLYDDNSALALDNIEGITSGLMLNDKATLILVSDNNFSASHFTQFVALQVNPVPEPEIWVLLLAGLALTGGISLSLATRRT